MIQNLLQHQPIQMSDSKILWMDMNMLRVTEETSGEEIIEAKKWEDWIFELYHIKQGLMLICSVILMILISTLQEIVLKIVLKDTGGDGWYNIAASNSDKICSI